MSRERIIPLDEAYYDSDNNDLVISNGGYVSDRGVSLGPARFLGVSPRKDSFVVRSLDEPLLYTLLVAPFRATVDSFLEYSTTKNVVLGVGFSLVFGALAYIINS